MFFNQRTTNSLEKIKELFDSRHQFLALAESCTGGLLSTALTSLSGSSTFYKGGICTYHNEAKVKGLGVSQESLTKYGAVSEEVAIEMVDGAARLFDSDWALSTTGIAGPLGGTSLKPVGTVWIGVQSKKNTAKAYRYSFEGSREDIRAATLVAALELLLEKAERS